MDIKIDALSGPDVIGFLEEHLQHMVNVTPPGSVHTLDIEALKKPEITFWSVWDGLDYILTEARRRRYQRVSLETGSFDAFKPARNLYTKFGFTYCEPFSGYTQDPNTVFMTIEL
jgi:putative acetyltransferase